MPDDPIFHAGLTYDNWEPESATNADTEARKRTVNYEDTPEQVEQSATNTAAFWPTQSAILANHGDHEPTKGEPHMSDTTPDVQTGDVEGDVNIEQPAPVEDEPSEDDD